MKDFNFSNYSGIVSIDPTTGEVKDTLQSVSLIAPNTGEPEQVSNDVPNVQETPEVTLTQRLGEISDYMFDTPQSGSLSPINPEFIGDIASEAFYGVKDVFYDPILSQTPLSDDDDRRLESQTGKAVYGVLEGAARVLGEGAGAVFGLGQDLLESSGLLDATPEEQANWDKFYGNNVVVDFVKNQGEQFKETTENPELATMTPEQKQNESWYVQATRPDFWTEEAAQGLGSFLGFIAPGIGTESAVAKSLVMYRNLPWTARALGKTVSSIVGAEVMTALEGSAEGIQTFEEIKNRNFEVYKEQLQKQGGLTPEEIEFKASERALKDASNAAAYVFRANHIVLGASNALELIALGLPYGKFITQVAKIGAGYVLEGSQESLQWGIQERAKEIFQPNMQDPTKWSSWELFTEEGYGATTLKGLVEGNPEVWKSQVIGGLLGGGAQAVGGYQQYKEYSGLKGSLSEVVSSGGLITSLNQIFEYEDIPQGDGTTKQQLKLVNGKPVINQNKLEEHYKTLEEIGKQLSDASLQTDEDVVNMLHNQVLGTVVFSELENGADEDSILLVVGELLRKGKKEVPVTDRTGAAVSREEFVDQRKRDVRDAIAAWKNAHKTAEFFGFSPKEKKLLFDLSLQTAQALKTKKQLEERRAKLEKNDEGNAIDKLQEKMLNSRIANYEKIIEKLQATYSEISNTEYVEHNRFMREREKRLQKLLNTIRNIVKNKEVLTEEDQKQIAELIKKEEEFISAQIRETKSEKRKDKLTEDLKEFKEKGAELLEEVTSGNYRKKIELDIENKARVKKAIDEFLDSKEREYTKEEVDKFRDTVLKPLYSHREVEEFAIEYFNKKNETNFLDRAKKKLKDTIENARLAKEEKRKKAEQEKADRDAENARAAGDIRAKAEEKGTIANMEIEYILNAIKTAIKELHLSESETSGLLEAVKEELKLGKYVTNLAFKNLLVKVVKPHEDSLIEGYDSTVRLKFTDEEGNFKETKIGFNGKVFFVASTYQPTVENIEEFGTGLFTDEDLDIVKEGIENTFEVPFDASGLKVSEERGTNTSTISLDSIPEEKRKVTISGNKTLLIDSAVVYKDDKGEKQRFLAGFELDENGETTTKRKSIWFKPNKSNVVPTLAEVPTEVKTESPGDIESFEDAAKRLEKIEEEAAPEGIIPIPFEDRLEQDILQMIGYINNPQEEEAWFSTIDLSENVAYRNVEGEEKKYIDNLSPDELLPGTKIRLVAVDNPDRIVTGFRDTYTNDDEIYGHYPVQVIANLRDGRDVVIGYLHTESTLAAKLDIDSTTTMQQMLKLKKVRQKLLTISNNRIAATGQSIETTIKGKSSGVIVTQEAKNNNRFLFESLTSLAQDSYELAIVSDGAISLAYDRDMEKVLGKDYYIDDSMISKLIHENTTYLVTLVRASNKIVDGESIPVWYAIPLKPLTFEKLEETNANFHQTLEETLSGSFAYIMDIALGERGEESFSRELDFLKLFLPSVGLNFSELRRNAGDNISLDELAAALRAKIKPGSADNLFMEYQPSTQTFYFYKKNGPIGNLPVVAISIAKIKKAVDENNIEKLERFRTLVGLVKRELTLNGSMRIDKKQIKELGSTTFSVFGRSGEKTSKQITLSEILKALYTTPLRSFSFTDSEGRTVNKIVIQPRIEIDLKAFNEQIEETEKEARAENKAELESLLDTGISLNSEGTFYEKVSEDGETETFKRASNFIDEHKDVFGVTAFTGNAGVSRERGTAIDTVIREFLDDSSKFTNADDVAGRLNTIFASQLIKSGQTSNLIFSRPFALELLNILSTFKSTLDRSGLVYTTKEFSFGSEIQGEKVAGTTDIIAYSPNTGTWYIIDIKTSTFDRFNTDNFYKAKDEAQQNIYRQLLAEHLGIDQGKIKLQILPLQIVQKGRYFTSISLSTAPSSEIVGTMDVSTEKTIDEFFTPAEPRKEEAVDEQEADDSVPEELVPETGLAEEISSNIPTTDQVSDLQEENNKIIREFYEFLKPILNASNDAEVSEILNVSNDIGEFVKDNSSLFSQEQDKLNKLLLKLGSLEFKEIVGFGAPDTLAALNPLSYAEKQQIKSEIDHNEFIITGLSSSNLKDLMFDAFGFITDKMMAKPGPGGAETVLTFNDAFKLYIEELKKLLPTTKTEKNRKKIVKLLNLKYKLEISIKALEKKLAQLEQEEPRELFKELRQALIDRFRTDIETKKTELERVKHSLGENVAINPKLLIVLKEKNIRKLGKLLEQMFKAQKAAIKSAENTDIEGTEVVSDDDGVISQTVEDDPISADDDGSSDPLTSERIFGQDVGVEDPMSSVPALLRAKLSNINEMTKGGNIITEDGGMVYVAPTIKLNFLGRPRKVPYQEAFYAIKNILKDTPNDIDAIISDLEENTDAFPWLQQVIDELKIAKNSNKKYVQQFTTKMPSHAMTMLGVMTKVEGNTSTFRSFVYNSNSNEASRILIQNWFQDADYNEVFQTIDGESVFNVGNAKRVVEKINSWKKALIGGTALLSNIFTIKRNLTPTRIFTFQSIGTTKQTHENVKWDDLMALFGNSSGTYKGSQTDTQDNISMQKLPEAIKNALDKDGTVKLKGDASVREGSKTKKRDFVFEITKTSDNTYRVEVSRFTSAKLVDAAEIVSTLSALGIKISLRTVERLQNKPIIIRGATKYFSDLFTDNSGVFKVLERLLSEAIEKAGNDKFVAITTQKEDLFESTAVKQLANFEVFYGGLLGTPSNFRESKKQLHTYTKRKMVTDKIMHILNEIKHKTTNNPDSTVFSLLNSIFSSDSAYLELLLEESELADEFRTQLASPAHASLNVLKQHARDYVMTKKLKDLPKIEQEFVQLVFFLESSNEISADLSFENIVGGTADVRIKKSVTKYFVPKMSEKDTEIILSGVRYIFSEEPTDQKNLFHVSYKNQKTAEAIYINRVILPELKRIIHSVRNQTNFKSKEYGRGSKLFMNTPILDSIVLDDSSKTLKQHIIEVATQMSDIPKTDGTKYTVEEIAAAIIRDASLKIFNKNVFRYAASETIEAEAKSRLALWLEGNLVEQETKDGKNVIKGLLHLGSDKLDSVLRGETAQNKIRHLAYMMSFNILIDAAEQQMLILGDPAHKSKISKPEFVEIVEAFETGSIENKGNRTITEGNVTNHETIFDLKSKDGKVILQDVTRNDLAEIWTEISKHSYINTGKRLANLIAPGERGVEKGHLYYFPIKDIEAASFVLDPVLAVLNDLTIDEVSKMSLDEKKKLIGWSQYSKINTADGQELGTWQEGLFFRYTKGDLSYAQMTALKTAIETKKTFDEFTAEERALAKILLEGKAQQPDKLVYTGHNYEAVENSDDKGVLRELYVKSSTIYLLPQLTAGREIDRVRILMEKIQTKLVDDNQLGNGLVRFPFESAVKVGLKSQPLEVLDASGKYAGQELEEALNNENDLKKFVSKYGIKASRKHLREQLSVTNKSVKPFASKNIRGSQSAKLLWADILNGDNGKAIEGFKYRGKTLDGKALYKAYINTYNELYSLKRKQLFDDLSLNSAVNEDTFTKLIAELAQTIVENEKPKPSKENIQTLTENKIQELFNKEKEELELLLLRSGFNPYVSHNMRKDLAKNISNLIDLLKREARARGYDISAQDGLHFSRNAKNPKTASQLNMPLWLNSSSDTFEALLNAVVSNRVHKIMFPGYSYVLTSDALVRKKEVQTDSQEFIEKNRDNIIWTKPQYAKQTNLLGHHVDNKGNVQPDQVIVQSKFMDSEGRVINLHAELETLRASGDLNGVGKWIKLVDGVPTLNLENFDEKLLKIFGMRIPTSGHMSMATIEIVGFAPPTSGDIVVAPRDLIVRMGSDFDIDKLYSYMRNHMLNSEGKLVSLKEEDLETYLAQILDKKRAELEAKNEDAQEEAAAALIDSKIAKLRVKLIEKFTEKFLLDRIIDMHFSVMENPHPTIQKNILKPLDTVNASTSSDFIRALAAKKPTKSFEIGGTKFTVSKRGFSPLSSIFQIEERVSVNSFKTGISVKSLNSTLHATIQQADSVASEPGKPVRRTIRAQKIVEVEGQRRTEALTVDFFGISSDGSFGRSETLTQTSGEKKELISFVNAEEQQTMLDGKKLDIAGAVNDTQITFPFRRALTLLGFYGLNVVNSQGQSVFVRVGDIICMQPVIVEFIKRLEEVQGQLKEYKEDAFNSIAAELFKELKDESTTDVNIESPSSIEAAIKMISLNYEDIASTDEKALQFQVLEKFILLTAIGNRLGTVQTLINSDSKRADKSIAVNIEKMRTILNISKEGFSAVIDNERINLQLTGLEGLLGDFRIIEDAELDKEQQRRREKGESEVDKLELANNEINKKGKIDSTYYYLESTYQDGKLLHVFLKPTTLNGLATVHVLGTASNIYESLFPYQSEQFEKVFNRLAKLTGIDKKSVNQRAYFRRLLFQEFKKHLMANSNVQRLTPNSLGVASLFVPYSFDPTGSATNGYNLKADKRLNRFNFIFDINGTKIRAVDLIHLYLKGYIVNGFADQRLDPFPIISAKGQESAILNILRGRTDTITIETEDYRPENKKIILTGSDQFNSGIEVDITGSKDLGDGKTQLTVKNPKIQALSSFKDLANFPMSERDYQMLGYDISSSLMIADKDPTSEKLTIEGKTTTLSQVYQAFKLALFGFSQDSNSAVIKVIGSTDLGLDSDGIIASVNRFLTQARNSEGETSQLATNLLARLKTNSKIVLGDKEFNIFSPKMAEPISLLVKLTLASYLRGIDVGNSPSYSAAKSAVENYLKKPETEAAATAAVENAISSLLKGKATLKPDSIEDKAEIIRSTSPDRSRVYQLFQEAPAMGAAKLQMKVMDKIKFFARLKAEGTIIMAREDVVTNPDTLSAEALKDKIVFENLENNPLYLLSKGLNTANSGGFVTFEANDGTVYKAEIITNNGVETHVKFSKFNLDEEYQKALEGWVENAENLEILNELKNNLEIAGQVRKKRLYDSNTVPSNAVNGNTHEFGLSNLLNFSFASQEDTIFSDFPDNITAETLAEGAFAIMNFSGVADQGSANDKYFFLRSPKIAAAIKSGALVKDETKVKGQMYKDSIMIHAEFYTLRDLKTENGNPITVIVVDSASSIVDQYNAYIAGANKKSVRGLSYHKSLDEYQFEVSGIDEMKQMMFFDDFGYTGLPLFKDHIMNTTTSQVIVLIEGTEKYKEIMGDINVTDKNQILYNTVGDDGLVRNIYVISKNELISNPDKTLASLNDLARSVPDMKFKFALYPGIKGISDIDMQNSLIRTMLPKNVYFPESQAQTLNHATEEFIDKSPVKFIETKIKRKDEKDPRSINQIIFEEIIEPQVNRVIWFSLSDTDTVEGDRSKKITSKITLNKNQHLPSATIPKSLEDLETLWKALGTNFAKQTLNSVPEKVDLAISSANILELKNFIDKNYAVGFEFEFKKGDTVIKLTLQEFLDKHALPQFFRGILESVAPDKISSLSISGNTGIEEASIKALAGLKSLLQSSVSLNVYAPVGYSIVKEGSSNQRFYPYQAGFKRRYGVNIELKRMSFPRFFKSVIANIENMPALKDYIFLQDKKRWSFDLHEGKQENGIYWNNTLQTGENPNFYASFSLMLSDNSPIFIVTKNEKGETVKQPLIWNNGTEVPEILTVSRLAQYLALYENLRSGGVQKAKEFAKFIPPFYYNLLGTTAKINSLDLSAPEVLGRQENNTSSFERTFIQSHPKYARRIRENDEFTFKDYFKGLSNLEHPYKAPQIVKLSPKGAEILGGKYKNFPKFISIFDKKIKEFVIYELTDTIDEIIYQRIDSYRKKTVSMYNSDLAKSVAEVSTVNTVERSLASYGLVENTPLTTILAKLSQLSSNPYFREYAMYLKGRIEKIISRNIPINLKFVDNIKNGEALAQIVFNHKNPQDGFTLEISNKFLTTSENINDFGEIEATLLHEMGHIDDVMSLSEYLNFSGGEATIKNLAEGNKITLILNRLQKLYNTIEIINKKQDRTPQEEALVTAYRKRLAAYRGKNIYEFITEVRTDKDLQKAMNNVMYATNTTLLDYFKQQLTRLLFLFKEALGVPVKEGSMLYEAIGLIEDLRYNTTDKITTAVSFVKVDNNGEKYVVTVTGNHMEVKKEADDTLVNESQQALRDFVADLQDEVNPPEEQKGTIKYISLQEHEDLDKTDNSYILLLAVPDTGDFFGVDKSLETLETSDINENTYLLSGNDKLYHIERTANNFKLVEANNLNPSMDVNVLELTEGILTDDKKDLINRLQGRTILTRITVSEFNRQNPKIADTLRALIKNQTIKRKNCD